MTTYTSHTIAPEEAGIFGKLYLDYINQNPNLSELVQAFPSLSNFKQQIQNRTTFPIEKRKLLADVLLKQYADKMDEKAVVDTISKLKNPNCFTITTGHQLVLAGGPAYVLYKIASVIHLCEQLKKEYPENDFVPVFWMASEDHDIDEIRSFRLYGKEYTWNTTQTGPVGLMQCDQELVDLFSSDVFPEFIRHCYRAGNTLSGATAELMHSLFKSYGLICLDAHDEQLKNSCQELFKEELTNQRSHKAIQQSNQILTNAGYETQVYSRPINLFYIQPNQRVRILEESFSISDLEKQISNSTLPFSPNVILRPVYQESVLPNLAYIGGPAEVAYWLQLKPVFDAFEVPFPIVLGRNHFVVFSKLINQKISKLGLSPSNFIQDKDALKEIYLKKSGLVPYSIQKHQSYLEQWLNDTKKDLNEIDKSLIGALEAEFGKFQKNVNDLEKKIHKAQEKKEEEALKSIDLIIQKLFPNQQPQERVDSFFNFYFSDSHFIHHIILHSNPLQSGITLLIENNE